MAGSRPRRLSPRFFSRWMSLGVDKIATKSRGGRTNNTGQGGRRGKKGRVCTLRDPNAVGVILVFFPVFLCFFDLIPNTTSSFHFNPFLVVMILRGIFGEGVKRDGGIYGVGGGRRENKKRNEMDQCVSVSIVCCLNEVSRSLILYDGVV